MEYPTTFVVAHNGEDFGFPTGFHNLNETYATLEEAKDAAPKQKNLYIQSFYNRKTELLEEINQLQEDVAEIDHTIEVLEDTDIKIFENCYH